MPHTNLVEPPPQSVIDQCTVWITSLYNDGMYYSYRYDAYDKAMLQAYAEAKRAAIDMMRSPYLSTPKLQSNGLWSITLNYYGVD